MLSLSKCHNCNKHKPKSTQIPRAKTVNVSSGLDIQVKSGQASCRGENLLKLLQKHDHTENNQLSSSVKKTGSYRSCEHIYSPCSFPNDLISTNLHMPLMLSSPPRCDGFSRFSSHSFPKTQNSAMVPSPAKTGGTFNGKSFLSTILKQSEETNAQRFCFFSNWNKQRHQPGRQPTSPSSSLCCVLQASNPIGIELLHQWLPLLQSNDNGDNNKPFRSPLPTSTKTHEHLKKNSNNAFEELSASVPIYGEYEYPISTPSTWLREKSDTTSESSPRMQRAVHSSPGFAPYRGLRPSITDISRKSLPQISSDIQKNPDELSQSSCASPSSNSSWSSVSSQTSSSTRATVSHSAKFSNENAKQMGKVPVATITGSDHQASLARTFFEQDQGSRFANPLFMRSPEPVTIPLPTWTTTKR